MQIYLKVGLMLLAATWLVSAGLAQKNPETEEGAIRNVVKEYQEAYNQQDAAKLASQWASDSIYNNPITGETAEGREAIEKLFKEKFAQGIKRHLEVEIKNIEFPNPEEAIENGVMTVTIPNQPVRQFAYQMEYVKKEGKWLLNAISEIELQKMSSHFENLKDLAWLVGKWEDADDNVDILFDVQWDKNKNFITQQFTLKIFEQDDIEGKQIIAWDPAKNVIRSWIFDSDGGIGEGTWEKIDKSWYATTRYTLSDGSVGSAINIYTPVNDRSYTFASTERELDGEVLPDMDPVTVEKVD